MGTYWGTDPGSDFVSFPANNNYFNVFLCFFWSRDALFFSSPFVELL